VQIAILGLLVVALALLVLALVGGNSTLAVCSIIGSLVAVALIVRGRRARAELAAARSAESSRLAAVAAERDERTRALAAAAAEAGRRAAAAPPAAGPAGEPVPYSEPVPDSDPVPDSGPVRDGELVRDGEPTSGDEPASGDESPADEPPVADTVPPLARAGQRRVWVIDGRPRYHLAECAFLAGRSPEPVALSQAVQDGFTPCGLCDPDDHLAG
jgi:hypothetical protein